MEPGKKAGEQKIGPVSKAITVSTRNGGVFPGEVSDLARKLTRLAELADQLGVEQVQEESKSLAERLVEGRFYVAVIGQFKRGKSTLLNALVGDAVLPTGVVPITTVPTILRFGDKRTARVRLQGGGWTDVAPEDLIEYVSEENNPENTKRVTGVDLFLPSPLLADGMCLLVSVRSSLGIRPQPKLLFRRLTPPSSSWAPTRPSLERKWRW